MVSERVRAVAEPPRGLRSALADPGLRIALTYFTVAQLLDILTTLSGLMLGFQEMNPLTTGVLSGLGAFGLLIQKVPVVLAVSLAVSLLPRRLAMLVTWSLTVVMAGVIASNAGFILFTHHR